MRHRMAGKALSRTPSHRVALRRNLAASLIEHGAIRTTEAKAKELRRFVERLITFAKKGTLHARRQVIQRLQDRKIAEEDTDPRDYKSVVQKLFDEVAPRYVDRPGGYTRIIRLSERRIGDAGVQVLVQLIEEASTQVSEDAAPASRRKRRAAKRHEAAARVEEGAPGSQAEGPEAADQETDDEAPDQGADEPAPDSADETEEK